MPNRRRAGQMFVGFQIDAALLSDMDRARGRKDRSQFIREAIAEKLKTMGSVIPDDLIYPPPRAKVIEKPSAIPAVETPKRRMPSKGSQRKKR